MQNITILGSTGSIGINTLDVISRHSDKYKVFALSAWNNIELLFKQIIIFKPKYVVVSTSEKAKLLNEKLKQVNIHFTKVEYGINSLCEIAQHNEVKIVMAAIIGSAGLAPTFAAVKAGKKILLANKESLVAAGNLFMQAVKIYKAQILPIDSEHNAIYQCHINNDNENKDIKSIILTASGGPFLNTSINELENITPIMACQHPKWKMGRKISVDSATMMNKGLEFIEAFWLFPHARHEINIVIHPQSIVHSLVEYIDGSILAQLSHPDMRIPIAYGLAYPKRIESGATRLDIGSLTNLNFYPPDTQKFICLELAKQSLKTQQCISLNAANEIAVEAFLDEKIKFTSIAKLVRFILETYSYSQPQNIDEVILIDEHVRNITKENLNRYKIY